MSALRIVYDEERTFEPVGDTWVKLWSIASYVDHCSRFPGAETNSSESVSTIDGGGVRNDKALRTSLSVKGADGHVTRAVNGSIACSLKRRSCGRQPLVRSSEIDLNLMFGSEIR